MVGDWKTEHPQPGCQVRTMEQGGYRARIVGDNIGTADEEWIGGISQTDVYPGVACHIITPTLTVLPAELQCEAWLINAGAFGPIGDEIDECPELG